MTTPQRLCHLTLALGVEFNDSQALSEVIWKYKFMTHRLARHSVAANQPPHMFTCGIGERTI